MKIAIAMIVVLALSFTGCSSQKQRVDNPPFELGEATCESWTGGRAESGSGLLLEIPILSENLGETKLKQAFFRGKITDIEIENTNGGWLALANFKNQRMEKPDITMHADSKREVGNQPPKPKEKFPFELEEDVCVLSFLEGGTLKYCKVENVKEKKPKIYK